MIRVTESGFEIGRAGFADIPDVTELLDEYRQFYGCAPDAARCGNFILERWKAGESIILLCRAGGAAAGFAQLYPTFSSIRLAREMILNDLFVRTSYRRRGVASALLEAVAKECLLEGASSARLATGVDNRAAQRLYRTHGWKPDPDFLTFTLSLT